jgi:hypothetical protein
VAEWTIKGGPVEAQNERCAGPKWAWEIARGDDVRVVSVLIGEVTRVDFSECPYRVWVGDDEYRADALVVVTGASTRGREAVEMYLDDDDPPLAMIVSTNSIRLHS